MMSTSSLEENILIEVSLVVRGSRSDVKVAESVDIVSQLPGHELRGNCLFASTFGNNRKDDASLSSRRNASKMAAHESNS